MDNTSAPPRKSPRGRPRNQETHRKIMDTVLEVVSEQGYTSFTVDEVARRSGVPKSTIYRRWRSKGAMLAEAMVAEVQGRIEPINSGTLRGDLKHFLTLIANSLLDSKVRQARLGIVLEAQSDPEIQTLISDGMTRVRQQDLLNILERGQRRGELAPEIDTLLLTQMMIGAVWYRIYTTPEALNPAFIDNMLQKVLPALPARQTSSNS
jgi:AcrR family transcriptional regulator